MEFILLDVAAVGVDEEPDSSGAGTTFLGSLKGFCVGVYMELLRVVRAVRVFTLSCCGESIRGCAKYPTTLESANKWCIYKSFLYFMPNAEINSPNVFRTFG
jgi:hypothetical protein